MRIVTVIFTLSPIAFGTVVTFLPDVGTRATRIAIWVMLTLCCLAWGVYVRRSHPVMGWCCITVCCLQAVAFLLPAFATAKTKKAFSWSYPEGSADSRTAILSRFEHTLPATTDPRCWPALLTQAR
jgi:hypothetical protein